MSEPQQEQVKAAPVELSKGLGRASTVLSIGAMAASAAVTWAATGEVVSQQLREKLSSRLSYSATTIEAPSTAMPALDSVAPAESRAPSVFSAASPLLAVAGTGTIAAATSRIVTTVPGGAAANALRVDALVAPIQRVRPKTPQIAVAAPAKDAASTAVASALAAAKPGKLAPAYGLGAGNIARSATVTDKQGAKVKVKIACKTGLVADKSGTSCVRPPAKSAR